MYQQINVIKKMNKMNGQRIIGILGTQLLKVTLKTRFYLVGNIECGQQTAVSFYYQRTRAFLLLSPACVASQQSYYLAVARYAHGNKTVNLLNNQTKSGKESINRFGLNLYYNCDLLQKRIAKSILYSLTQWLLRF